MREKDIENTRLIHSLTNVFLDVYELDLETELIHIIRTEQDDMRLLKTEEIDFSTFKRFLLQNVPEEKKKKLEEEFEIERICARIQEVSIVEREFQKWYEHSTSWFRIQFILSMTREKKRPIVTVTVMNIDDLKRLQEEQNKALLSAYESARQASRAKSDFLANMSHDIRTPMNAIMGMSTIARRNIHDPEKLEDCLNKIDASSKHLLSLINSVLDMSKIESGKVVFVEEVFQLDQMIEDIKRIVQPQAEKKDIQFTGEYETLQGVMVKSDPIRIRQVLLNIVGNAIKFTPEKGKVHCSGFKVLSIYDGYSTFEFTCEDNGIGMDQEFVDKIFQPYERSKNVTSNEIEGSGPGMFISKNIVEMMNGEIYVESKKGEGTKFTVIFHLKEISEQPEKEKTEQNEETQIAFDAMKGKRILLVEDNDMNREIAQEFLTEEGILVENAVNGKEAVEKMEQSSLYYYDLILMDIQMPVMNGYEASAAIRRMDREDSGLPIIAMTANAFSDDIRQAKEAGMNEHIAKPIDVSVMFSVLSDWMNDKRENP